MAMRIATLGVLWWLLATMASFAQQQDCCLVSGVVADPSGLPIPGAAVQLLSPEGQIKTVNTDAEGRFQIGDLLRGRYKLTANSSGFKTAERRVDVQSNVAGLTVNLELAAQASAMTVTDVAGRVELAPTANQDAVELDRDLLDALPVLGGDVTALAGEMLDPALPGEEGATLVVDGVETRDLGVTSSAIREVRVNRNPFSAEYSRPGNSRIEVITKQGSPEFHGDLNVYLRDYRFDARNAFALERPQQSRRTIEGSLSGPIQRSGKTTFVFSAEREEDNERAIVYALTPDSLVQQNVRRPEIEDEASLRITRYHNDRHVFSGRYRFEKESNSGQGIGGEALPEAGFDQTERSHRVYLQHRWFPSATVYSDLSLRAGLDDSTTTPYNPDLQRIVVRDAFVGGGAQRNLTESRTSTEMSWTVSWMRGNHTIRGGFLIPDWDWYRLNDRSNFGGTFTFASLDDYVGGRPLSFTRNLGDSALAYDARTIAFFVQDDYKLRPNLMLGLGLRYDRQNLLEDANNLAPRIGLSWGLGPERKTVIRAGFGVFYDRLRSSALERVLRFDGQRVRQLLVLDPAYPDPSVGGLVQASTPNIYRFDPALSSPYLLQSSLSVEHEINRSITAAVTWRRTRGVHTFRTIDANAPAAPDYVRPVPEYAGIHLLRSTADLKAQYLSVQVNVKRGRLFRGTASYTLGRRFSHVDGESELPPNSRDLSMEWGRASWDRRHRFRLFGALSLPWNLTFGTVVSAQSGRPYEWSLGRDINRDGLAIERPAGVGRNALEGPGSFDMDVRLGRRIRFGPDNMPMSATISVDAFNVLNRVNFTRVVGNEASPFFGLPVAADSARRMQLSLRFSF